MLCKLKDRAAPEDKNSIVYDNNYSNCEAVYFGKSLKWTQLICQDLRNTVGKHFTTLAAIRRNLLIRKAG